MKWQDYKDKLRRKAALDGDSDPAQWIPGDVIQSATGERAHVTGPLTPGRYLPLRHIAPASVHHGAPFSLHPAALVSTYKYRRVGNEPLDKNWLADPALDQPGTLTIPEEMTQDPDKSQSDLTLPEGWS